VLVSGRRKGRKKELKERGSYPCGVPRKKNKEEAATLALPSPLLPFWKKEGTPVNALDSKVRTPLYLSLLITVRKKGGKQRKGRD